MIYTHALNYCDIATRELATTTFDFWGHMVPREVQLTTMREI